jgi:hypothetical protein
LPGHDDLAWWDVSANGGPSATGVPSDTFSVRLIR